MKPARTLNQLIKNNELQNNYDLIRGVEDLWDDIDNLDAPNFTEFTGESNIYLMRETVRKLIIA